MFEKVVFVFIFILELEGFFVEEKFGFVEEYVVVVEE